MERKRKGMRRREGVSEAGWEGERRTGEWKDRSEGEKVDGRREGGREKNR